MSTASAATITITAADIASCASMPVLGFIRDRLDQQITEQMKTHVAGKADLGETMASIQANLAVSAAIRARMEAVYGGMQRKRKPIVVAAEAGRKTATISDAQAAALPKA